MTIDDLPYDEQKKLLSSSKLMSFMLTFYDILKKTGMENRSVAARGWGKGKDSMRELEGVGGWNPILTTVSVHKLTRVLRLTERYTERKVSFNV